MHYNFIKQSNRRYLEELHNRFHEMPSVVDAVNTMQKTEWVINKFVFDVVKTCFKNNIDIGDIPVDPKTIPLPVKPHDIATNKEARTEWKRKAQKVYKQQAKSKSKWIQVRSIIEEAEMLLSQNGFYYPYQLDFRGRIYPKPAMLSPQNADYSRALIKFKKGRPMGTDEAFADFAIAGAGLFGEVDKEELEVRTKWVEENHDRIISTAKDPFNDKWWCDADKPFCFLAWCDEYRQFAETDFSPNFVTTLPLQSDCSNSGLQHYSAMMLDEIGGKATNLIPSNKPNDVYGLVAKKVIMKLRDKNCEMSQKWLAYGIDRKLCKKPVMCLPYSLTQYSCRQYIQDHLEKENKEHEFGEDLFKPTQWLTPIVWEAINDVIKGAKSIMKFLKDISRLVASENLPVTWTTPLGLPVFMSCYKKESKRVKTKMGDSIVKLSVASETKFIDKRKTGQSICPNFIHSLDASVLQLAVCKAKALGIDEFSLIHDSFGVVAPDVTKMAVALREAFCEIYSQDVLANWALEMKQMLSEKNAKKMPNIPAKGNLNLSLVKDSVFFCV